MTVMDDALRRIAELERKVEVFEKDLHESKLVDVKVQEELKYVREEMGSIKNVILEQSSKTWKLLYILIMLFATMAGLMGLDVIPKPF